MQASDVDRGGGIVRRPGPTQACDDRHGSSGNTKKDARARTRLEYFAAGVAGAACAAFSVAGDPLVVRRSFDLAATVRTTAATAAAAAATTTTTTGPTPSATTPTSAGNIP